MSRCATTVRNNVEFVLIIVFPILRLILNRAHSTYYVFRNIVNYIDNSVRRRRLNTRCIRPLGGTEQIFSIFHLLSP